MRISTMDWLGQSQYVKPTVYWASLSSAISEVSSRLITTPNTYLMLWSNFQQTSRSGSKKFEGLVSTLQET